MLILAPDPSGDFIASRIAEAWIRAAQGSVKALGGSFLKSAGADVFVSQDPFSTIGFVDAVLNLPKTLKEGKRIEKELMNSSVLVIVDGRYLLERFSPIAKKMSIPVVWVAPSPDWKKKGETLRTKKLEVLADLLLVTDEMSWMAYSNSRKAIRVKNPHFNISENKDEGLLGFFLGSRKKEVERLMPVFLKLAERFKTKKIIVSDAFGYIGDKFNQFSNVEISKEDAKKIIPSCRVAVACNGTLVQQCVVSKTPVVAVYKTSNLLWNVLSVAKLFGKTPKFWTHPNIFAEKEIIPERIQNLCNPDMLEKDINDMWINKSRYVNRFLKITNKYNSGSTLAESVESIKTLANE